jgi:hypothetical protein
MDGGSIKWAIDMLKSYERVKDQCNSLFKFSNLLLCSPLTQAVIYCSCVHLSQISCKYLGAVGSQLPWIIPNFRNWSIMNYVYVWCERYGFEHIFYGHPLFFRSKILNKEYKMYSFLSYKLFSISHHDLHFLSTGLTCIYHLFIIFK